MITGYQENKQTVLIFEDQGVGISPQHEEKVFSLDTQGSLGTAGEAGTGLGLVLCRDLIKQNKGTITIESKREGGTSVEVRVPCN